MGNCWPPLASQQQQGQVSSVFTWRDPSGRTVLAAGVGVGETGKVPRGAAWRCCCSQLIGPWLSCSAGRVALSGNHNFALVLL